MYNVSYIDLIQKEKIILDYALKFSDAFSIVTKIQKPYSKIPPNFENPEVAKKLEPFAIKYIFDRNEWPIKYLTRSKHQIMVLYSACKESRQITNELPNVFLPLENNLPEDICFYRNEKAWLITISHEKIAYMDNPTANDIEFFKKNGICFYSEA